MTHMSPVVYKIVVGCTLFALLLGTSSFAVSMLVGQGIPKEAFFQTLLGMLGTAVFLPMLGLYALFLYEGDYRAFFDRVGKSSGFLLMTIIMIFIGPFGALARSIALSFAAWQGIFPSTQISLFTLFFGLALYFCTLHKSTIMIIIGTRVVPILIFLLSLLFVVGFLNQNEVGNKSTLFCGNYFRLGLSSGNQVIGLLGVFFFSHILVNTLKQISIQGQHLDHKKLVRQSMQVGFFACLLLAFVYIGLLFLSSDYSSVLEGKVSDRLLETLSFHILGNFWGMTGCIIPIVVYFVASIAFTAVFAEFLHYDVSKGELSYSSALIVTLLSAFITVLLNCYSLFYFVSILIYLLYPALITLTLLNIIHKVWHVRISKASTLLLMVASIFCVRLLY